jgi:hypothetical protein
MERETMLKGSGHVDNFELNRALSKRNLNY